ncbi:allantoate permease [Seiridium cupressi]
MGLIDVPKSDVADGIQGDKKAPLSTVADDEPDLKHGVSVEQLDEAEIFLRDNGISHHHLQELMCDKATQRRLVRRVDWTLLPLLAGTYLLQYIDKQALSYGVVFDLFDTTGVTSNQYSWLASIFYFAYLVAEWPCSYLVQHYPTSKVIGGFVVCWGCVLTATAGCSNFAGLAVCRFLLGCFEAVITPSFMMMVSMWYVRAEQPSRAGIFYCTNGIGSMVSGILFYGVGFAQGWDVWRIISIICGGCTIVWGVVLWFLLPSNILTARGYTIEEKAMLIARSQSNNIGVYNRKIKTSQVKEALMDGQVWLLFLYVLLNECTNGGIASFGKLIVKGFTDDALMTVVYGIPYGAWVAFFILTGPWLAGRLKNWRTWVMMIWVCPTIIAACLFWQLPRTNKNGLLMAYYICPSFVGSLVVALQMPAANLGGYTKRTTATAFVFLAYCIGNIIGPHAFLSSEAPIYQTGCKFILGCSVAQIVVAAALRSLLVRRNKVRDAAAAALSHELSGAGEEEVFEDLTDFENPKFRYAY